MSIITAKGKEELIIDYNYLDIYVIIVLEVII